MVTISPTIEPLDSRTESPQAKQLTGKEYSPSAADWIKDLLGMVLPVEQDPVFCTASPSHQEACTSLLSSSIRGQTEEARTTIPQLPEWKPQLLKAHKNDNMDHSNSMKLWAMACRPTQDRQVMLESSVKTWSNGEGNGKSLHYSCLKNPLNSMKSQKDVTPEDEPPGLI